MKYTKEQLDQLSKDPFAKRLAAMMGLDLDRVIKEEKEAIEDEERKKEKVPPQWEELREAFKSLDKAVGERLDQLVKEGKLTCEEVVEDGVTKKYYKSVDEGKKQEPKATEEKKEYNKPTATEQPFLMNQEQLENFINKYRALIEARKKVEYLFGIKFEDGGSGFDFTSKVNEIIWDFVRVIFGDENAEDIVDYVFGNSNFDSVERLYNELT